VHKLLLTSTNEVKMIQLRDKENGIVLGEITADDLQFLIDNLEEESEDDTDYFINRSTLEIFKEKGTNKALITLLEDALGDRDDMEVEWFEFIDSHPPWQAAWKSLSNRCLHNAPLHVPRRWPRQSGTVRDLHHRPSFCSGGSENPWQNEPH
jgi:hypothetical protein